MPDAISCVGVDVYSTMGKECLARFENKITFGAELKTILNEPHIIIREIRVILQNLQNYSIQLGKFEKGDDHARNVFWLNLWSVIKNAYFPRGWLLLISLLIFSVLSILGWRQNDFLKDLALVSFVCLPAFITDSYVQIFGDGQRDLLKHLFIANMLYDFVLIFSLNIIISFILKSIFRRKNNRIGVQEDAPQSVVNNTSSSGATTQATKNPSAQAFKR